VQRQVLILGLAVMDLAKDPAASGSLATSTIQIPALTMQKFFSVATQFLTSPAPIEHNDSHGFH
jgi:hypothetical protein